MEGAGAETPLRPITAPTLQWFVNRHAVLVCFRDMLERPTAALALTVTGPDGIGKTWLLKRLRQEVESRGQPAAMIDFSAGVTRDLLWLVHRAAEGLGAAHFPALNAALRDAAGLKVILKIESAPGSGSVTIQGGEVKGDVAGRDINIITGNSFQFTADNPDLRQAWRLQLSDAFFADLEQLGQLTGAVLLFDSSEQMTKETAGWVSDELCRRLGEGLLPGVRVAVAGERPVSLPQSWSGLTVDLGHSDRPAEELQALLGSRAALAIRLDLDPLPAAEVRTYLRDKRGLAIDEDAIQNIYVLTGGQPDLLALAADGDPEALAGEHNGARLREILVARILHKAGPSTALALRLSAIARWIDASLLAALLGERSGVDQRLAELRKYSFIDVKEEGRLYLRLSVRECLLHTWDSTPLDRQDLHERVAQHFEGRADAAARAGDTCAREEYERLAVEHWLLYDENEGRSRAVALFERYEAGFALAACEQLLQVLRSAQTAGRPGGLTMLWQRYLDGRLALLQDKYEPSAKWLGDALAASEPNSELHALAQWSIGQLYAEQGAWAKALEQYDLSGEYFAGVGDWARAAAVRCALGDVYLQEARALGGPAETALERGGMARILRSAPAVLVALAFVASARLMRRWRLPPLQESIDYSNWTLVRLLLTAEKYYQDAIACFRQAQREDQVPGVQWRLAQTYTLLGWWPHANDLFKQALASQPVMTNAYLYAQVQKEYGVALLNANDRDGARTRLAESAQRFDKFRDGHAQAEVALAFGRLAIRENKLADGLDRLRQGLTGLVAAGDQLGTGLALHALWSCARRCTLTPEQRVEVERLTAQTPDKLYFQRVPDPTSTALQAVLAAGLLLLLVGGLVAFGLGFSANLLNSQAFLGSLYEPETILAWLARLLALSLVLTLGIGVVGLILASVHGRAEPRPEHLDTIATSADAIERQTYRGQPAGRLAWQDVRRVVWLDRALWRAPIRLLSGFRLYGTDRQAEVRVPATILWYDALQADVRQHLTGSGGRVQEYRLDLHVFRSLLGLALAVSPLALGLGSMLVYNWIPLPVSVGLAAQVGPILLLAGTLAALAGPYWWFVLHPLWVQYRLQPRSAAPAAVAAAGLLVAGLACYLLLARPYFPIRTLLDRTLFPLGFALILLMPAWVLLARAWPPAGGPVAPAAFGARSRAAAALGLFLAVLLTAYYAFEDWYPDTAYTFQAIAHYYHGDYGGTLPRCNAMAAWPAVSLYGYDYCGRAQLKLGQYLAAADSFDHVIDSGQAIAADYVNRAIARFGAGQPRAACADLKIALDARRWPLPLSETERVRVRAAYWQVWPCEQVP